MGFRIKKQIAAARAPTAPSFGKQEACQNNNSIKCHTWKSTPTNAFPTILATGRSKAHAASEGNEVSLDLENTETFCDCHSSIQMVKHGAFSIFLAVFQLELLRFLSLRLLSTLNCKLPLLLPLQLLGKTYSYIHLGYVPFY